MRPIEEIMGDARRARVKARTPDVIAILAKAAAGQNIREEARRFLADVEQCAGTPGLDHTDRPALKVAA